MKERIQVTQALLRELYNYDRETGEFTFKVRRGRMLPGTRARHERALVDGDFWGSYYACLPCLDRAMSECIEDDDEDD